MTGRWPFSSAVVLVATSMNESGEGRNPEKCCLPRWHRGAFAGMTDRLSSHSRDTGPIDSLLGRYGLG